MWFDSFHFPRPGLNPRGQLDLFSPAAPVPSQDSDWLLVGGRPVRVVFASNRRARRYLLRLRPDHSARVTVPRGGSRAEARRFAERNILWLEKQLLRQMSRPRPPRTWGAGTEFYFRGLPVRLQVEADRNGSLVRFAGETVRVSESEGDLRPGIERHLWQLARVELAARVFELAALHQFVVRRVVVRNQRSRWGSCSRRGTISLNWRLVQAPLHVRDYIVLHEMTHLKQMNHSRHFWAEVARLCPEFALAEGWLKQHSGLLA